MVIQVKRYNINNKLGSEDIRFYATLYQQEPEANSVVVVTSGEFTNESRELADELKVETVNGEELIEEIKEYDVKPTTISSSLDQNQPGNDNIGASEQKSINSESVANNNHQFRSLDDEWQSDKLGSHCPACGSTNCIWESEYFGSMDKIV